MKIYYFLSGLIIFSLIFSGCSTAYKPTPVPIKHPSAYKNSIEIKDAILGAKAFEDPTEARKLFGFDIRGAGLFPIQIVMDNQGTEEFIIVPGQTFLEDDQQNLWPVLSEEFAYERVSQFAKTNRIFREGSYKGFLTGTAGALIGAAIGIVTGENVGEAAGKGAAAGFAAGAVAGGVSGMDASPEAVREVMNDFENKNLKNKTLPSEQISYGFIFFPGEAKSTNKLRLQLKEKKSDNVITLEMNLS